MWEDALESHDDKRLRLDGYFILLPRCPRKINFTARNGLQLDSNSEPITVEPTKMNFGKRY